MSMPVVNCVLLGCIEVTAKPQFSQISLLSVTALTLFGLASLHTSLFIRHTPTIKMPRKALNVNGGHPEHDANEDTPGYIFACDIDHPQLTIANLKKLDEEFAALDIELLEKDDLRWAKETKVKTKAKTV